MTVVTADLGLLPDPDVQRPRRWIGDTLRAEVQFRDAARRPVIPPGSVTFLWKSPAGLVLEMPGVAVAGRVGLYRCEYQAPTVGLWQVRASGGDDGPALDWTDIVVVAEPPGGPIPQQAIWVTSQSNALVTQHGTHLAGATIDKLPTKPIFEATDTIPAVDGEGGSRSLTGAAIFSAAIAAAEGKVGSKADRAFALPLEGARSRDLTERLAEAPSIADFGVSPEAEDNAPALAAAGGHRRIVRAKPGDFFLAATARWDASAVDAALRGEAGETTFHMLDPRNPALHLTSPRSVVERIRWRLAVPTVPIPGNDSDGLPNRERASLIYLDKYAAGQVRWNHFQDAMIGVHLPGVDRSVPIEQRDHTWGTDISWNDFQDCDFGVLGNWQKQFTFIGNKGRGTTMNADALPPHQLYLSAGSLPGFYNGTVGAIVAFNQDYNNPHSSSWKLRITSAATLIGNQSDSCERIMDLVNVTRPIVLGTQGWNLVDKVGDTQQAGYGIDEVSWGLFGFNTTWLGDNQNNIIGAVIEHGSHHNYFFGNLFRSKKLDLSQGTTRPLIRFNDCRDNVVERPILVVEGPADYLVRLDRENNQLRLPTVVAPAGSVI
ncbi:hypothetical protein, partial [Roseomonas sp. SXEYE001]